MFFYTLLSFTGATQVSIDREDCDPGTYWKHHRCNPCPKNTFSSIIGSKVCHACDLTTTLGTQSIESGACLCKLEFPHFNAGTGRCQAQNIGACPVGTFTRFNGDCQHCSLGTYSNITGASRCQLCDDFSTSGSTPTSCICKAKFCSFNQLTGSCSSNCTTLIVPVPSNITKIVPSLSMNNMLQMLPSSLTGHVTSDATLASPRLLIGALCLAIFFL